MNWARRSNGLYEPEPKRIARYGGMVRAQLGCRFLPSGGGSGPAYVHNTIAYNFNGSGGTSVTAAVTAAAAAGDTLILSGRVGSTGTSADLTGVSDTQANSWVVDAAGEIVVNTATHFYAHSKLAHALSTTDTITLTFGGNAPDYGFMISEYSGLAGTYLSDGSNYVSSATSNTVALGASETPPLVLVAMISQASNSATTGAPSGFTNFEADTTQMGLGMACEAVASGPSSTFSTTWSWTGASAGEMSLVAYA